MENKDLLFMLENGEEFIKGKFIPETDTIQFLSFDEEALHNTVDEVLETVAHIYEENRIEVEILAKEIKADQDLINKIKNNPSMKLLFRYKSNDFNKLLNLQ